MDAIASASSASWYHSSGTPKLSCKQCLCIYKDPCLARACWTQPKPVVLHRADAGFAFFQNALSALRRSAQPSRAVMFTGIGIVSQQAEHARQGFNAVRALWPLYAQRHCLQKLNEKAERKYYTVLEFKILMMALLYNILGFRLSLLPAIPSRGTSSRTSGSWHRQHCGSLFPAAWW